MSDDRNATCENRIDAQLLSLERWYRRRYKRLEKAQRANDDAREEELHEELEPLAVSARRLVRVEFFWGGPSAHMDAEVDNGQVVAATFHFLDWFDGASRSIDENSNPALLRLAEEMAEVAL
ncbi:hypothetical protein ThrDRAFT_04632 [Frankia casuarinae]|uniref:Uncharacterized protein n=1 Tax=Frankia casuarinae (strain DSM 45818 / CECT 9043 / HFP020203 / CcI3) TaxID=106370 RepID=Q2J9Y0_FRACC|nr:MULTISPECIES: hypothetical protein [Frankia]ABD11912.1 hypothetical protein Francci3_2548 [Frankia casuarinae]ESZ99725.1 hypothetical protein CcI6DRAFT_04865 [Frankia sp. CcI6]EYT89741.1 hypothetical protein ThrDRAFT_04632 [Frankia casuarinae]KDA40487.1 hypothetical protein BMG523Draft_04704 [Frankia sp. BMG5.23]KEZ34199.1 hypothetical protein CEDDRAFT_04454 [Frankia sp. CeD]